MPPLPKKAHWPPAYIYLQTAAIAVAVWVMTYQRYQDDAYISLTYARNLLSGDGLVLNAGEYVEGYSNFLFLMLTAVLGFLGMDLVLASKLISFASYFGLVFTLSHFLHAHYKKHFPYTQHNYAHRINTALAISLAASSAIVLAWCSGGLETVFFAMLLTIAVCRILKWIEYGTDAKGATITGLIFALAALTRIEALMVLGITGLFLGMCWLLKIDPIRIKFKHLLLLGLGFLALFMPYMGWRLMYFGEWLPNTYWAKVFGIPSGILSYAGFFYFIQFMIMPPMLPVFSLVLLFMAVKRNLLSLALLYLMLIIFALCLQVIKSGGDHMFYLRFFVPVVPLLALVIYYCNVALIPHNEKRFRDICGALIVLSALQFGMVRTDETFSAGAASGIAVSGYIKNHWPEGSRIALNPIGALPYFTPGYYYVDMLGLTDKHIASRQFLSPEAAKLAASLPIGHQKGDGAYVLSRKPDYIIFGNASWGSDKPYYVSDQEIASLPEFKAEYERVETYITPPADIMDTLKQMAKNNEESAQKNKDNADFVRNPVLNRENQLRFIYYQRKKEPIRGRSSAG